MKKKNRHNGWEKWLRPVIFAFVLLLAGIGAGILATRQFYKRHVLPSRPPIRWDIEAGDTNPASWGKWFPDHYQSYLKGLKGGDTPRYTGEIPPRKVELRPALEILWAGYEAAPDIRERRGHPRSLEDVERAAPFRNNRAGCLTCKSAEAPLRIAEMGLDFYEMTFPEARALVKHPVSCSDCHDSETMALQLTREPFIQAYSRAGGDLKKAGRQEMRSLVCAQCHVTYFMDQATGEVKIPWDEPPALQSVEAYYAESTYRSWTHERTGTGIPKIRHPDFEFFSGGAHHVAGVSCADCHMPFLKTGNRKITSHEFASPADNVTVSCGVCHRQSEDYLRDRIAAIQEQVQGLLTEVEKELVRGISLLQEARNQQGADAEALARAQRLHFMAFLRYDWVFAANSKGFHNPREALLILAEAMRLAKEMQTAAREASEPQ
jgi:nitrite reductase (cytochrome c-552)